MIFTGRANWLSPAQVSPRRTRPSRHEAGHQWWYGVVATNEFENGWMDEGFNTWATARVIEETRPGRI
jgi:hypothetical protein